MRATLVPGVMLLACLLAFFGIPACSGSSSGDADGGDGSGDLDGSGTGDDSNGTDGGGRDGSGGDVPICDEVEITASSVPPNLLLVVDKSGSMDDYTSGNSGPTKMQDLKNAVDLLLTQGQGSIRFGWMSYPNCGGACNWNYCDPGTVSVGVGDDSVSSIQQRLSALTSAGGTPTGESLQAADSYYTALADSLHRCFVLLITDGLPTCPSGEGSDATQADADLSLQWVRGLRSSGVDTFVIGLGEGVNESNPQLLNDMAEAGGWPRDDATKYFQANSLADLEAVLDEIGGMVIGCDLVLGTLPEFPAYLWVYFDGQAVPKDTDHVDGWDYDAQRNAIVFYGSYCELLRDGQVESVEVEMGCAPPD